MRGVWWCCLLLISVGGCVDNTQPSERPPWQVIDHGNGDADFETAEGTVLWQIRCETVAVEQRRTCTAFREDLRVQISQQANGTVYRVLVGNSQTTHDTMAVRVDQHPPISSKGAGFIPRDVHTLITQFHTAQRVVTRYEHGLLGMQTRTLTDFRAFPAVFQHMEQAVKR